MKKLKIIAPTSFDIDEKHHIRLDPRDVVHFPDGLADFLISNGVARTSMSAPVTDQHIELGDIDPALFSEDGDQVRGYLTANARVRWHTPGKPANAGNFEGREQFAAGRPVWLPRSVFKALEKKGVAVRVSFAAKRVDAKIDANPAAIDLGWMALPEGRVRAA